MGTARSEHLHFSIDGEWLTEHSRNLVREDRWEDALHLLVESLHGFTWNDGIEVLSGRKWLVGINNLELVDQPQDDVDLVEYLESLVWLYSDRYKEGAYYYRPYAVVSSWAYEDARYATERVGSRRGPSFGLISNATSWSRARTLFYARDRLTDRVESDLTFPGRFGGGDVLFEQVPAPPVWIMPKRTAQASLDAFLAVGKRLENIGPARSDDLRQQAKAHLDVVNAMNTALDENNQRGRHGSTDIMTIPEIAEVSAERIIHADRAADALAIARGLEEEEREEREAEEEERQRVQRLHERVVAQASAPNGGGFIYLELDGAVRKVPRAPFENWALWRTAGAHLAHPWSCVASSGERMYIDDAYHTDWLVGTDPTFLQRDRESTFREACYDARGEAQRRLLGFECVVLAGRGRVDGKVLHPKPDQEVPPGSVLVLPSGDPEYTIPALSAGPRGCVITEKGGTLAHLVQIALEDNLRIVRVENALTLYPEGTLVTVDLERGTVRVSDVHVRDMFGERP